MNADEARALLARLLRGIAPEIELDGIDPDAMLQDQVDLDSMDFLNLVSALRDETGIDVPAHDFPQLASIRGFVDYVATRAVSSARRLA